MTILSPCVYVHHVCVWALWQSEEDIRFPGPGLQELRFTVWELGTEPLPSARAAFSPALVLTSYHFPRYICATVYIARPDVHIYF